MTKKEIYWLTAKVCWIFIVCVKAIGLLMCKEAKSADRAFTSAFSTFDEIVACCEQEGQG